jgi:YihY family inner membrane protein
MDVPAAAVSRTPGPAPVKAMGDITRHRRAGRVAPGASTVSAEATARAQANRAAGRARALRPLLATGYAVREAVATYLDKRAGREAAQVALFLLLSFPAALLLVISASSAALDSTAVQDRLVDALVAALPLSSREAASEIETLLDGIVAGAGAIGWIGSASLLWTASGAISALRVALNEASSTPHDGPIVRGKLWDLLLVPVVTPVATAAVVLSLSTTIPPAVGARPWIAGIYELLVTRVAPFALLLLLLAGLFWFLPARRGRPANALAGALAATVGLELVRTGAEVYFRLFPNSSAIYGALGGILAVALAVYAAGVVIVVAAHFAAALARRAGPFGGTPLLPR